MNSPMGKAFPVQLPQTLGFDVAGIVKGIGAQVKGFKPGDRVMGLAPMSAYVEFIAMEEEHLVPVPDNLTLREAGAVPTVGITAWQALFHYGQIQPGQRILIHAGSGGVGHVAVQLAKQHGAYVIATARESNHSFLHGLGADEAIDYTRFDFAAAVTEPVDFVLDSVMDQSAWETGIPGETGQKSLSILKDGGKYVSIVAYAADQLPKQRNIQTLFFSGGPNQEHLQAVAERIRNNQLKVHIEEVYPFTVQGINQAYRHSEMQAKRGKIVISRE